MSTYQPPRMEPPYDAPSPELRGGEFLGHPKGLFLLFLVEMWERFSYYGMRALLVLYLISVIAVHQLTPGVYTNTLEIKEMPSTPAASEGAPPADAAAPADATAPKTPAQVGLQTRTLVVLVGANQQPPTVKDDATGPIRLSVTRLEEQDDPEKPGQKVWKPLAEEPLDTPLITRGEAGAKGQFTGQEHRVRISNPSDEPVKAEIRIRREGADARTFFRINDNVGTVGVTIQPDKLLKEGEKPFELTIGANTHDSGRNWLRSDASVLYGWYTGLAYLFPILGGIIADKLIGTHRSMLVGGLLISIGHVILGISGLGEMAQNPTGLSLFIMGLAVIVLGTGHFKPTVSVMVGQLYKQGDPRRDGAFTIFYMGINLGAFLCAFICGTLGEKVGWHWGFGSAAVGMILGLLLYMAFKPVYLKGIGDAPRSGAGAMAMACMVVALVVSAGFAFLYHLGAMAQLQSAIDFIQSVRPLAISLIAVGLALVVGWVVWFVDQCRTEDRGPVITIFVFMFFNAFFWLAFEQAGSSINIFTEANTDRSMTLPSWLTDFCTSTAVVPGVVCAALGLVLAVVAAIAVAVNNRKEKYGVATVMLFVCVVGLGLAAVGILKPLGYMQWVGGLDEVPATWFQSVNAGLIFILAPIFAAIWTALGRKGRDPSQPAKIALGLIFLGLGYVFMVMAGKLAVGGSAKAGMWLIFMTYFWHTVGELCLSPTGLSYVTKAAPAKFVSLLMGIWFISSFIANLGGGLVASYVEEIEAGKIKLPWSFGGQADFFALFVVTSIGAGIVIFILTPLLKKLMRPGT